MTADEIKRMVGERVFRSFWPERPVRTSTPRTATNLTDIGQHRPAARTSRSSKRAAESDLIVYVNINLVAMDGGHKSVAVGLASYQSLKHHHNVETMMHSQLVHGPASRAQRDQRLRRDGWAGLLAASGVEDLPDRDHGEQRHVPDEPRAS